MTCDINAPLNQDEVTSSISQDSIIESIPSNIVKVTTELDDQSLTYNLYNFNYDVDVLGYSTIMKNLTSNQSSGGSTISDTTTLTFDQTTGLQVASGGTNSAIISMNGFWRNIVSSGQTTLVPVAVDTLRFIAGTNISVTTASSNQSITIDSTGSPLTVKELDGSPSVSGVTIIQFNQANGLVLSASGTTVTVDFDASTISELATLSGRIDVNVTNITSLSGRVTTVSGLVLTNTSNITTNSGLIGINTNNITTLSGRVTTNSGLITINTSNITTLSGRVTTVSGQVVTNINNIFTLSGRVTTLSGVVATNTSNITTLSGRLTTVSGTIITNHNSLSGLNGASGYYHLSTSAYSYLSGQNQSLRITDDVIFDTLTTDKVVVQNIDLLTYSLGRL